MGKIKIIALFLVILTSIISILPNKVFADQLYDKGRSFGTYLANSDTHMEMNVISAAANKSFTATGWLLGVERVRAWARMDNLQNYLPASLGYCSWINGAQIRLSTNDSRKSYMFITGMNPPDYSSSTLIPLVIWDILDYLGIPHNIITAYANNFSTKISSSGLGSYDAQKTFTSSSNNINLPNTYTYSNADAYTNMNSGSSAEVYFNYQISTTNNSSFAICAQSKIQYGISYQGSLPWYWWTNYATINHTIN